jgi:hypothetical protein
MEPNTAKETLQPLLDSAISTVERHGATPEQIIIIKEALETLNFALAWSQLTWDHSFPAWLQFCEQQKRDQLSRPERRRLEVVKK